MMTRAALDEAIRSFKTREPFQPFVIECDDGRRFTVREPNAVHCLFGSADYWGPDGELNLLDNEVVSRVVALTDSDGSKP